jgi:hypothetical protein
VLIRSSLSFCVLVLAGLASTVSAQTSERAKLDAEIQSLHDQITEKENAFLRPSFQDEARYRQFLLQPQTGLVRLQPREKYESKLVTPGGGAFYSFVRLTHDPGYGSDVWLERGTLHLGLAGADLGLITAIGDLPIETIDLHQPAAEFLAAYAPPSPETEARAEHRRIYNGANGGGYIFHWMAVAELNNTYVMRVIHYEDSDVLVAFRIVSQDSDGSITLLWRILQKFPTPDLVRAEP